MDIARDVGAYILPQEAVAAQVYSDDTTAINGSGIDRQGYYSCTFFITKAGGDAADDLTFTVQESSDDGSSDAYADYNDADGNAQTVQVTGAADTARIDVRLERAEQYVRINLAAADATLGGASTELAVVCVLGGADELPAA